MTLHGSMKDTSDLRAWYREDIYHLLSALCLASTAMNEQQRIGFDVAVKSIALAVGIDAEEIIHERPAATTVL